jgi:hypothetical protein
VHVRPWFWRILHCQLHLSWQKKLDVFDMIFFAIPKAAWVWGVYFLKVLESELSPIECSVLRHGGSNQGSSQVVTATFQKQNRPTGPEER